MNAFVVMVYPLIRALLGRGFESPPSIPARVGSDWDVGKRYRDFTKVVYVSVKTEGEDVVVEPSIGETEKITFLTQSDAYLLLGEDTTALKKGGLVRAHRLPGLSSP